MQKNNIKKSIKLQESIKIIEVATDLGCTAFGARLGAGVLGEHLAWKYGLDSIKITCECEKGEKKSRDKNDKAKNIIPLNACSKRIYDAVLSVKCDGFMPLVIGGDHSIAIASALASLRFENLADKNLGGENIELKNLKNENLDSKKTFADSRDSKDSKNLGIIWIDAHADFNTFESTPSGKIHGMPLATITGNNGERLTQFHTSMFHNGGFYKNKNVAIIGGRDIDKLEHVNLKTHNIAVFTTMDVKNELDSVLQKSLEIAMKDTSGFHVSLDIDVIDPLLAPGVSVKAKNGIDKQMLFKILKSLFLHKDKIKSFDFVEFNPARDKDDRTKALAQEIVDFVVENLI